MVKLENCPICKLIEWHNLDYLRNQRLWYDRDYRLEDEPVGFKVCKNCGFVTYDYLEQDRLNVLYDKIRSAISGNNVVTCNRKNEYHKAFLEGIDFNGKRCLDIGCAQGALLSLLKDRGAHCAGVEVSEAALKFAKYEYGIMGFKKIPEVLFKWDFVSLYHVLEHLLNPEQELKNIYDKMADDGLLYISVPFFYRTLDDAAGQTGMSFEDLYHLNHVSLFSEVSIKNLFKITGFEIIKENFTYYGNTFLCKKVNPVDDIEKENYLEVEEIFKREKEAMDAIVHNDPARAIDIYPYYPDAYIILSINKDNMKKFDAQVEILSKGLDLMPNNMKLINQLGKVYFQFDENKPDKYNFYSNNIRKSEELFLKQVEEKPGNDEIYYFLALIESKYKKNQNKAVEYLKKALEINPFKFGEVYSLIGSFRKDQVSYDDPDWTKEIND